VGNAQERSDEAVAAGLGQHAEARVHQDDGQVGGGGSGGHVAGVLHVPGVSAMMKRRRGVEK